MSIFGNLNSFQTLGANNLQNDNYEAPKTAIQFHSSDEITYASQLLLGMKFQNNGFQNLILKHMMQDEENKKSLTYFSSKAKLNAAAMDEFNLEEKQNDLKEDED